MANRFLRKKRIRAQISGRAKIPRVVIFRSNKYLYIQAIDDQKGQTLAASSTLKDKDMWLKNFTQKLKDIKISRIVFDRAGYKYHGKIKNAAENLRKLGLEF